jgi:hypothetical protein
MRMLAPLAAWIARLGLLAAAAVVIVTLVVDSNGNEACRVPSTDGRLGGPAIRDPVEQTLQNIRRSNTCNQPDPSTAKATRSTWDTAHAIVQSRGAPIIKLCEPYCSPDDHTRVWIVEVRGTFVPPQTSRGGALAPDSMPEESTPNTPVAGTWFAIIAAQTYE